MIKRCLALLCLTSACAPVLATSDELLRAGRDNPLAACSQYCNEGVEVTGQVIGSGIYHQKDSTRLMTDFAGEVLVPRGMKAFADAQPYVVLGATDGSDAGGLICLFRPNKLDEASTAQKGHTATLRGRMHEINAQSGKAIAFMYDCRVQ